MINIQVGLITKYGFPVEVHEVKTDDGYLLTMHRIPEGRTNKGGIRPPVFLQHGVLMSSDDWIINGPEKAIGIYFLNLILFIGQSAN